MRIESTGSVAGNVTSQTASQTTASAAAVASKSSATSTASSEVIGAIDPATGQTVLPKFPWITRLTLELERNAQKSSPFEAAKIVGETIDKLA